MKRILFLLSGFFLFSITYSQGWEKVKAGGEFTIAIKSDGSLWGWGFNGNGQLGMSADYQLFVSPTKISDDMDWKEIVAGAFHSLAIKNNGTLWGAGLNSNGQIGAGTETQYEEFVQIGTDTDWVYVEAGYVSSYAIKKDGSLWAWGYNGNGQLGLGHSNDTHAPTRVGSDNDWQSISCGGLFVLGLKKDKSLWQWGFHVTIDGSEYIYDNILQPYCVNDKDNWIMISAGLVHVFALKEDGTLWAYGENTNFSLGDTSIIFADEFTQITQNNYWQYVEAGSVYTFALNSQGELFAWGNNMLGQLGIDNDDVFVKIPTKVNDETDWQTISAAKGFIYGEYIYGMHSIATKSDINLVCVAGANYVGQLGLGYANNDPNAPFNCSSLSIEEKKLINPVISIFPNPASDQININAFEANILDVIIYDIMGKEIKRYFVNDNKTTLDVSALQIGLYVLKIKTKEGLLTRKVQIIR
ncbi:MAG TPA: T9SS type A sorting domain-containing protein [Bacteroidales bacterium]|nr:T9SS type A sorting domain-containing protein [Bacteroidales bacterium]